MYIIFVHYNCTKSIQKMLNDLTIVLINFSLKKTVMKLRPQINGPIDVGYGNYILSVPVDKDGRRKTSRSEEDEGSGAEYMEEKPRQSRESRMMDGKYDVSELLSSTNTLTNPSRRKNRLEL